MDGERERETWRWFPVAAAPPPRVCVLSFNFKIDDMGKWNQRPNEDEIRFKMKPFDPEFLVYDSGRPLNFPSSTHWISSSPRVTLLGL